MGLLTPALRKKIAAFDKPTPAEFMASRDKTRYPEFLTQYGEEDLLKMHLGKVRGSDAGYAVKSDGDIVNVHNNGPKGEDHGAMAVIDAIKNGGTKLDFYDSYLTPFYKSLGFKEVGRDKFAPEWAHENWVKKYGKDHQPDVIYMEYGGKPNDPTHAIGMYEAKWGRRLEYDEAGTGISGAGNELLGGEARAGMGKAASEVSPGLTQGGVQSPVKAFGFLSPQLAAQQALQEPTFDPTMLLTPSRFGGGLLNMGGDAAINAILKMRGTPASVRNEEFMF